MENWIEGHIVENRRWTERLFSLRVEAESPEFKAGQFTNLGLDIDGERVARPYSFVNAPGQNPLEFYAVTIPEGDFSTQMYELQEGQTVWIKSKSFGFLTLDEVPDSDYLWLMSTGTAIGPFLSILKTDEPWNRFKKIILIHAVRRSADLSYQKLIRGWSTDYGDRFCYTPFVSRESCDYALAGRLPDAIEEGRLEAYLGVSLYADNSQVMICGNPEMVKATTEVLKRRGLTMNKAREPGNISVERYW